MFSLCLLNRSKGPQGLGKRCSFSGSQQSSSESTGFDGSTSSKVSMQGHIRSAGGGDSRRIYIEGVK